MKLVVKLPPQLSLRHFSAELVVHVQVVSNDQANGCGYNKKVVLLKDGVYRRNTSDNIFLFPLGVSVAGSALGYVIEKPFVLCVIQSSRQARRNALVPTQ